MAASSPAASSTAPATDSRTLRIGHSPDPDDAFMWWPLANFVAPDGTKHTPRVDTRGYRFEHVLEDIQSLNERSARGELEITALSIHQYPFVAKDYQLTSCGASMGDGYGPMLVANHAMDLRDLVTPVTEVGKSERAGTKHCIAIPGTRTSAWLALQLRMLEEGVQPEAGPDARMVSEAPGERPHRMLLGGPNRSVEYQVVPFDQIIERVASGEFTAGLIIHEGQLTYAKSGLVCVEDLGKWWKETRGLPLPLGGNAIRRDVGGGDPAELAKVCGVLLDSIRFALQHREEAVRFALQWGRGLKHDLADKFVGMYVNSFTLDYGDVGRAAVEQFLKEGIDAGIIPPLPNGGVEFVSPS